MGYRPHPKHAATDSDNPRAWGTCDRTGFVHNLGDLRWDRQWAGNQIINTRFLVGPDYLDIPQEQLRSLVIPADPEPIFNARPENYVVDETDWRATQDLEIRETQDGELRVTQPSETEAVTESTE